MILEAIRFLTVGLMVALSAYLLRRHPRSQPAWFGALFALCMAVYVLFPFVLKHTGHPAVVTLLLFPTYSSAFLFWMFCRSLFSEDSKASWLHWSLLLANQVASYAVFYRIPATLFRWSSRIPELELLRKLLPQGLYLGFILAAIVASQREGRADLVDSRIRLRRTFLGVVAFYGVLICATEILLQGQPASRGTDAVNYSILFILTGLFFREIKRHPELFDAGQPPMPKPTLCESGAHPVGELTAASQPLNAPKPVPSPLRRELQRLLGEEKIYRVEGLTHGQLAERLKAPEYRLRACIHQELGFRNFNDFLNHYRVLEACARLRSEPDLPILNLSMDLGYRSLAPFNRAFKAKTGRTPTQFRGENPH